MNGTELRTRRKALGLTQQQLSDLAGCTVGTISHFERGTSQPQAGTVVALERALEKRENRPRSRELLDKVGDSGMVIRGDTVLTGDQLAARIDSGVLVLLVDGTAKVAACHWL